MIELLFCVCLTYLGLFFSEVKFLGEKWKKLFRLIGVISALIFLDLVISNWNQHSLGQISVLILSIWAAFLRRVGKTKKGLILYLGIYIILLLACGAFIMISQQYNNNIKTNVSITWLETRKLYISDDTPVVRTKDSFEYSYIKNGEKESDSVSRDSTHLGYMEEASECRIEKYLLTYTQFNNNVNPPEALEERKEIEYLLFILPGSLKLDE